VITSICYGFLFSTLYSDAFDLLYIAQRSANKFIKNKATLKNLGATVCDLHLAVMTRNSFCPLRQKKKVRNYRGRLLRTKYCIQQDPTPLFS